MGKRILSAGVIVVSFILSIQAQNVEVTVTGIRNTKGQIGIGVFIDDEGFQKDKAIMELRFPKKDITGGEMKVTFTLEPGVYGLAVLDDEDSDALMKYNFLHIPREGFGFSDYYHTGFTKPKFDSFRFTVLPGQPKKITVRIRYI